MISHDLILRGKEFKRLDETPFWQFLEKNSVSYAKEDFPFLTRDETPEIRSMFDFSDYLNLKSSGEGLTYLYRGLGRSLNYVGPILDLEREHGFNDHTDRHTLWVFGNVVELLKRAGVSFDGKGRCDAETEMLATLVGLTHDLGNFIARKGHQLYSVWILSNLFSDCADYPTEWEAVKNAIFGHDESYHLNNPQGLKEGLPLQWALVAADKMHVGRDRIGGRSRESGLSGGALDHDSHILVNLLVTRSTWRLGAGIFYWYLDFSLDQLDERFAGFAKNEQHIGVSQQLQDLFKKDGIKLRDGFAQLFENVYSERVELASRAVFSLFPFVSSFEVVLTDNDTKGKVGSEESSIIRIDRNN